MCGDDDTLPFGGRWFDRFSATRWFGGMADRGLKPTATFGGRSAAKDMNPKSHTPATRSRCHLRFSPEGASLCQSRPAAWVANPQRSDSPNGAALNWTNTKHVIDEDER